MSHPLIVLAHGAGAGQSHPFMQYWRDALARDFDVVAFDYTYMASGRKAPDRLPKLLARHREVVDESRLKNPDAKLFLIGKSMGSRVGCHLANEFPAGTVTGVVCLGYPLKGRSAIRDEVLLAMKTPILFVQGTRDPLCPLDLLSEVRPRMTARNDLFVVDGGDHSLKLRKRDLKDGDRTQEEVDATSVAAVRRFIQELAGTG